ncbi:MAG: T9SS type A sorting domain-containing protein [Calditrichaeota bacterium]|nr:T9SS type A sorting domain-containing protein [Calditrichota bacterium]
MNRMKMLLFLIVGVALCVAPIQSFAQTSDTLTVYATPNNLNDVITGDTLSTGAQAHHVYKLVSLDTTYKFSGTITSTENITVLGVPDPSTGRPPCIQPAVLEDGSIPGTMFNLNAPGIKGTFKNLYLLALATNNTANGGGVAIQVSADNVRLTVNNCVFDGWQTFAIGYNGNWDDFFISNSNFRNMVHPNQWYIGEVIRNEWPGTAYTDTMSMKNNVMLAVNGYAACPVTKWYTRYFEFIHNKVLYTFKNPLFIFNVTNAKINNNVFYGTYAGGVDQAENPWWDNLWHPDTTYGVIALDSLSLDNAKMFCPEDSSKPDIASIAESRRTVEVKNNTYFWPTTLTDFWAAWNDTASDKIITPNWMNDRTKAMFADKTTWPGLVASNNVNADVDYMDQINTGILSGTTGNDIGLLAYFKEIRTGTAATDVWGYGITQVSGAPDWKPTWPLPEMEEIPTRVVQKNPTSVPSGFALYQNYPNPFNPETTIRFALPNQGHVKLVVYNMLGQPVRTLIDKNMAAGSHTAIWNGTDNAGRKLSSGIYYCRLQADKKTATTKMLLLK